jgi:CDP-diacylglycerol--glycerol-3-phosphate 3-phosphatidyltransferase
MASDYAKQSGILEQSPAELTAQRARLFTVANGVSLLRVALVPYLLYLVSLPPGSRLVEVITLSVAIALTDFFDGYIARRTHQVSHYGRIVDPLADKICIILVSTWLAHYRGLPSWIPALIVVRDVVILGGSFFLLRRFDIVMPSNQIGRVATFILTITLFAYLIGWEWPQMALVWVSGALVLATFVAYVRIGWVIFHRLGS